MSITPEKVAEFFTDADNDFHEGLDAWPSIRANGNVVEIRITPMDEVERLNGVMQFLGSHLQGGTVVFIDDAVEVERDRLRAQLAAVWALAEPWRSADVTSPSMKALVYGVLAIRDRAALAAAPPPSREHG